MPTYEPYKGKEADLQKATAKWISLAYPNLLAFHVPNGGLRPKTTIVRRSGLKQVNLVGADLKLQGVMTGVPDWVILQPSNGYHGLLVELKNASGKLTKAQEDFLRSANDAGYCVRLAQSVEEFVDIVNNYLM